MLKRLGFLLALLLVTPALAQMPGAPIAVTGSSGSITSFTTQQTLDKSTAPATDAFVWNVIGRTKGTVPLTGITSGTASFDSLGSGATFAYTASGGAITSVGTIYNGGSGYKIGDIITPTMGNSDAYLVVSTVSGTAVTGLVVAYGGSGYTTGTALGAAAALDTNNIYVLTGTLTGNVTFLVKPGTYGANSNSWIIVNNTTGAFTVSGFLANGTNTGSIGNGVVIPQGTNSNHPVQIFTDGVNDIWLTLPVYATTTTASALVQSNSGGTIDPSFLAGNYLAQFAPTTTGASAGAVQTASWTVPQIIAQTSINGTSYLGTGLSLSFNGAGTGAGGMDTGSMPSGGALYIYAIYKPGTGWSTLGTTTAPSSGSPIYGGANMPAGYTASCLLWSGVTSGTNFVLFQQEGRRIDTGYITIISAGVGKASATSQSLSAAIPPNAMNVSGIFQQGQTTGTAQTLIVTSNSATTVGFNSSYTLGTGITGNNSSFNYRDVPLITPQTIYYQTGNTTASSVNFYVNGYLF